jgi:hypothetical protein
MEAPHQSTAVHTGPVAASLDIVPIERRSVVSLS